MRARTLVAALFVCLSGACAGRESGAASGGGAAGEPGRVAAGEPDTAPARGSAAPAAEPTVSPLRALRDVPILTGSSEVERSGTPEALQLVFLVPLERDSVAALYRRVLPQRGWRIKGDATDGGVVRLYAERNGPPLWIRIQGAGPGAAQYTIIGAPTRDTTRRVDSTVRPPR
jgi:hypothetical protein